MSSVSASRRKVFVFSAWLAYLTLLLLPLRRERQGTAAWRSRLGDEEEQARDAASAAARARAGESIDGESFWCFSSLFTA